jgi:hypothetical protein
MTNKVKGLFSDIIKYLSEEGIVNPVEMLAPLFYGLNQHKYQKLRGHIKSSNEYQLSYRNISGGYNDGNLIIDFMFPSANKKTYVLTFTSVDIVVSESVGSITWNGDKKELMKYVDELTKTLNGELEIIKLKQEIAKKQRKLKELTKVG